MQNDIEKLQMHNDTILHTAENNKERNKKKINFADQLDHFID